MLRGPASVGSMRLGDIMVREGTISREDLAAALEEQRKHPGRKLGQILVESRYATEAQVHYAMARRLNLPFVHLQDFDFDSHALAMVEADFARAHGIIPLMLDGETLVVAVENAGDPEVMDLLHFITDKHIAVVASSPEDIDFAISKHYAPFDEASVQREVDRLKPVEKESHRLDARSGREGTDRPIVYLVDNIILDAIRRRASDIHIRPREHSADLIFRIDGSLITVRSFHRSVLPSIVSRVKVLGNMDISEHRLPQDGQSRMLNRGRLIDLRLSVIPTIHGESVVIRILDASQGLKSLGEVGLARGDEERFRNLLSRNQGLLLVTGPTGSGKSTTLYAALQEVRKQNVNIITVEDPVEYHLDGINQIQVNSQTGYTFARALRHILRHDPDVVMVGEIRDVETARMAVESSLTGHLVLSTLHTNSAATSITRLMEIGVDAYLVSATLSAVMAQRLIRLNCPHCLEEEEVSDAVRRDLGLGSEETFYRGGGCDECYHTGFRGRHAAYELLPVTPAMRSIIRPGIDADALEAQAVQDGMVPLTAHAVSLAREGKVSITEVYRIRLN